MTINGREIKFRHTVAAHCEIAALCPGHDLSKFSTLLDGDYLNGIEIQTKFIMALNKGYEDYAHYENPDYVPNPVKAEELAVLDVGDFINLFTEAGEAFAGGAKQTVEAEEVKTKKEEAVEEK